jgi:hypothetical protein
MGEHNVPQVLLLLLAHGAEPEVAFGENEWSSDSPSALSHSSITQMLGRF